MSKEEQQPTKKEERFSLVQVPTQTELMFRDNSNEEMMNLHQAILSILNDLASIRKSLVG